MALYAGRNIHQRQEPSPILSRLRLFHQFHTHTQLLHQYLKTTRTNTFTSGTPPRSRVPHTHRLPTILDLVTRSTLLNPYAEVRASFVHAHAPNHEKEDPTCCEGDPKPSSSSNSSKLSLNVASARLRCCPNNHRNSPVTRLYQACPVLEATVTAQTALPSSTTPIRTAANRSP